MLFQSGIKQFEGKYQYIMDFDGYARDVDANQFIEITDTLHTIIHEEFYSNITEEFKNYMRRDIA